MIFDELTKDNWIMFAMKHYDNPTSVTYEDFEKDLNRFITKVYFFFVINFNLQHNIFLKFFLKSHLSGLTVCLFFYREYLVIRYLGDLKFLLVHKVHHQLSYLHTLIKTYKIILISNY